MDLDEVAESVKSKQDLARFVAALCDNLRDNPEEWENVSLDSFLDAFARYLESMDNIYANIRGLPETAIDNIQRIIGKEPPTEPSWTLVAHFFLAAKVYE
jgi:hypothetical protein